MHKHSRVLTYARYNSCPIIFDLDGTLTSLNYGEFTAFNENDKLDGSEDEELRAQHIYKSIANPLPTIQQFLKEKNPDDIYVVSREEHGQEEDKKSFVGKYYGIPKDNCFFVKTDEEKIETLKSIRKRFGNKAPVYIDDNEDFIREVEAETDYITAHVTLFFMHGEKEEAKTPVSAPEDKSLIKKIIFPATIIEMILLLILVILSSAILSRQNTVDKEPFSTKIEVTKPMSIPVPAEEEPEDTPREQTPPKVVIITPEKE